MSNVLIIDDEPAILRSLSRTLDAHKLHCDTTTDPFGHGILNHECDAKYAPCKELVIIISDYNLNLGPDKSGLDFLKEYQLSLCRNKHKVLLILSSGNMPVNVAVDASRLGIKTIEKPYNTEKLISLICGTE